MTEKLFAIGVPGELPRQWVEGEEAFARAQLHPGEVMTSDIAIGDDGRPVPAPMPAPATPTA